MPDLLGVIVEMETGWPGQAHLRFASKVLGRRKRAWFYWPNESAIEVRRSRSARQLLASLDLHHAPGARSERRGPRRPSSPDGSAQPGTSSGAGTPLTSTRGCRSAAGSRAVPDAGAAVAERSRRALRALSAAVDPVPLGDLTREPGRDGVAQGLGVYLRTDFWAQITSGGSYGHTCYVAKELAAVDRAVRLLHGQPVHAAGRLRPAPGRAAASLGVEQRDRSADARTGTTTRC